MASDLPTHTGAPSQWPAWLLTCVTAALYAPVARFSFVHFDDPHFFYGPPQVRQGVNPDTLRWALTNTEGDYWHPVGSVVHLVACTLFPLHPGWQHLVTIALFLATVFMLFAVLRRMTRSAFVAFFAAALWAWHPLRVESVAWLTERWAVIAALFCMLALGAYVRYARRPGAARYVVVALCFTLAMLSKPTLPGLPLGLLAVDLWPLGRMQSAWRDARWRGAGRLVLEKVPLLLIALGISLLTFKLASASLTNLSPDLSPAQQVSAIAAGYGWFVLKTLLPSGLAVHHPWSNAWPAWPSTVAALVIIAATAWVLWSRRVALIAGWLWFLVMLFPMLAGTGLRTSWVAGRYALLPHVLLLAAIVASLPRTRFSTWALSFVLGALAATSAVQLRHWRNSETLFTHALAVTRDNHVVHHNLGVALQAEDRIAEAAEQYAHAVRIKPDYLAARVNLGAMLDLLGDRVGAERHYRAALEIDPTDADAQANLAALLAGGTRRSSPPTQPAATSQTSR